MKNVQKLRAIFIAGSCFLLSFHAISGVVLSGNRVIYRESESDKALQFSTKDAFPYFVEIWVERDGDSETHQSAKPPFIVTPQVFRLAPQNKQPVRLIFNHSERLPKDRESLFYLKFLQAPAIKKNIRQNNNIFYRVTSKVKLFYRPENLSVKINQLGRFLELSLHYIGRTTNLVMHNPTPYFITITDVIPPQDKGFFAPQQTLMVAPFEKGSLNITRQQAALLKNNEFKVNYINDFGRIVSVKKTLK